MCGGGGYPLDRSREALARHPSYTPTRGLGSSPPPVGQLDIPELKALIDAALDHARHTEWSELRGDEWELVCRELRYLALELGPLDPPAIHWPVDARPPFPWMDISLRQRAFELHVQIGRTAENTCHPLRPYFQQIGNYPVNYHWWLAGSMLVADPGLEDILREYLDTHLSEVVLSVGYYANQIRQDPDYPAWKLASD